MFASNASKLKIYFAPFLIFFLLITLPYIAALLIGENQMVFGGFLLNPIDGNSYLAKMYQGWRGDLEFHLPFTSEQGKGAYLFLFYIFLGHVARMFGLPLLVIFHGARILGALFLSWVLYRLVDHYFAEAWQRRTVYLVLLVGLGSGWILLPFGYITSDLWVAEAFPFLSAYVNPHFTIGLGLMVVLIRGEFSQSLKDYFLVVFLSFLLAIMLPFGIIIVIVVLSISLIFTLYVKTHFRMPDDQLLYLLLVGLGSFPVIIYDLWVTFSNPLLRGWNDQNITLSPPIWDLIISFSPALIIVFWTGIQMIRRKAQIIDHKYSVWLFSSMILLFLPFGLQRRMISGLYIPVILLAFSGIFWFSDEKLTRRIAFWTVVLSIPSTIIVIFIGLFGISQQTPEFYLWKEELAAFSWIEENLESDALILASPETGLLIPAYTGRRVYYGHPYETINAQAKEREVIEIFQKLEAVGVDSIPPNFDYIFLGPREVEIIGNNLKLPLPKVFDGILVDVYLNDKIP